MKYLRALLGKAPKPRAWDVTPESERPAPKKRDAFDEPTVSMESTASTTVSMESTVSMETVTLAAEDSNPFLDDEALDTMKLEPDTDSVDDPYQSYSWQMDPENDTRSLRTIPVGTATEKDADALFNPYDTGSQRRGWKK